MHDEILKKVHKEYDDFRKRMLEHSKQIIFGAAFKINFYDEVVFYFENVFDEDDFEEFDINYLIDDKLISKLYDYSFRYEGYSTSNTDLTYNLIKDYLIFGI